MGDLKDSVIRLRIDKELHQAFKDECSRHALNPSELMRVWIKEFTKNSKEDNVIVQGMSRMVRAGYDKSANHLIRK